MSSILSPLLRFISHPDPLLILGGGLTVKIFRSEGFFPSPDLQHTANSAKLTHFFGG